METDAISTNKKANFRHFNMMLCDEREWGYKSDTLLTQNNFALNEEIKMSDRETKESKGEARHEESPSKSPPEHCPLVLK